jgi:CheY-like chemotaxis protein
MYVLVADDDPVSRTLVSRHVRNWGYEPLVAQDGAEAWELILTSDRAMLAILDWSMPHLDGVEVCRRVRSLPTGRLVHAILLTGRASRDDVLAGLQAGADDYLTKPFDPQQLYARLQVGARILALQQSLADRVRDLERALTSVKQLQGLLPMCSYCKCIRDDRNYWMQLEHYLAAHSEAQVSHGICPRCFASIVEPQLEALRLSLPKPQATVACVTEG